jgi:hypothetical protein
MLILFLLFAQFNNLLNDPLPVLMYEVVSPNGEITVYADNDNYRDYTIEVLWNIKGLRIDADQKFFVIPRNSSRIRITKLRPVGNSYSYTYRYVCYPGNLVNAKHDDNAVYIIPFLPGTKSQVMQGYNEVYSHKGVFALDLKAESGTPICAAREGLVVEIKKDSKKGCANSDCSDLGNFIRILHSDGTEGLYLHLSYSGVLVKEGEFVKAGLHIGYSGATGWVTGPHLHFEVLQPDNKGGKSVPTKFLIDGQHRFLRKNDLVKG